MRARRELIVKAKHGEREVTIEQAIKAEQLNPSAEFTCLECQEKLSAHEEDALRRRHFEHYAYVEGQNKCSLRDKNSAGYSSSS